MKEQQYTVVEEDRITGVVGESERENVRGKTTKPVSLETAHWLRLELARGRSAEYSPLGIIQFN